MGRNNVRSVARRRVPALIILFACVGAALPAAAAPPSAAGAEAARKLLVKNHLQLLMEKGVCDDRGREVRGRLGELFAEAGRLGFDSSLGTVQFVLSRLNYRPRDLAGFPDCAFDRPFGEKLLEYGHAYPAGIMDGTSEASACPVGGIGAGSFERTMSGNFRTWFLKPGWTVDDTVWADQFHVWTRSGARTVAHTLSADAPKGGELASWRWNYPSGRGSYYALFPKSGFSYDRGPDLPVKLAVVQFSPVIPDNYKETSYPVAVYKWIAENPSPRPVEVSILLTWENMVGWEAKAPNPVAQPNLFAWDRASKGLRNEVVDEGPFKGVVFRKEGADVRTGNAMTGTMAIAALEVPGRTQVTRLADFDPRGRGEEVWDTFSADGTLAGAPGEAVPARDGAKAAAVAVKFRLGPGERLVVPFAIAWDLPFAEFAKGTKFRKRYTEFYGADGGNAFRIAREALESWADWEKAIDAWQEPVIRDARLPDWFKQALFNELYLLTELSIWDGSTGLHTYLESADYLMYGTFDVDAYCWHVLKLWPRLEIDNMRFFAGTIDWEDPAYKAYQYALVQPGDVPPDKLGHYWNANKVRGMVPHDIGSPRERPWVVLNAFDWQNGNVWKDLNPKFPLRALRDHRATGRSDPEFLKRMFKASVVAMDTLEKRFGDPESHVPLNEGIPDQTYDTWRMKGESAYVGHLWLAALLATREMGEELVAAGIESLDGVDVRAAVARYGAWFEAGRPALEKLWNEAGGYYNIDAHTDDIMTDQLFGAWYAAMAGIGKSGAPPVVPAERVRRTLRTIYEKNVLGFGGGLMGAVNGRTASGAQLRNDQGDEVWVGTAYAFAANCILNGLVEEGLHTAYGIYHVVYSPYGQGYFFKTPEAYRNPDEAVWNTSGARYGERLFRPMKYMRAGAVWAVYEALLKK